MYKTLNEQDPMPLTMRRAFDPKKVFKRPHPTFEGSFRNLLDGDRKAVLKSAAEQLWFRFESLDLWKFFGVPTIGDPEGEWFIREFVSYAKEHAPMLYEWLKSRDREAIRLIEPKAARVDSQSVIRAEVSYDDMQIQHGVDYWMAFAVKLDTDWTAANSAGSGDQQSQRSEVTNDSIAMQQVQQGIRYSGITTAKAPTELSIAGSGGLLWGDNRAEADFVKTGVYRNDPSSWGSGICMCSTCREK